MFDLNKNSWTHVLMKSAAEISPRDDHAICNLADGGFISFGGFINGSRVNEVVKFNVQGIKLDGQILESNDL